MTAHIPQKPQRSILVGKQHAKPLIIAAVLAIAGLIFLWQSFAAVNPNLQGDLNGDNKVTISDLSILLSNFNKTGDTADLNGDGKTTIADLSILLSNWGKTYSGGTTPPTAPPTTPPTTPPPTTPPTTPPAEPDFVIAAAGDIADGRGYEKKTAALITADSSIQAVLALGDLAYDRGTDSDFKNKYDPSWGQFKAKTKPTPGNHEYDTSGASGYFNYWNKIADYYSFNLNGWHFISLNSNIARTEGSAQMKWLQTDLSQNASAKCTLAFWHHPRFSSGDHTDDSSVKPFYQALYNANADLILQGHSHIYEKYSAADADGKKDEAKGIRSFVIGTGGGNLDNISSTKGPLEYRNNKVYGVMKLTLSSTGYSWKFIDIDNNVLDEGTGTCH